MMNPKIDLYIADGCGRCEYYATAKCKVRKWQAELEYLRQLALDCGLTEELKWGVPCYTWQGHNVLIISAFKEYCSVSFFKGVLLTDEHHILIKQGEHSQMARLIKFTNCEQISEKADIIKAYLLEAINIEEKGLTMNNPAPAIPLPAELVEQFEELPDFKQAFFALSVGRQRGYLIYFSEPKQAATRTRRIKKYVDKILAKKGLQD